MVKLIFFLSFIFSSQIFAQIELLHQENEHSIFIDYTPDSQYKQKRAVFLRDNFDNQTLEFSLQDLKKKANIKTQNLGNFPTKWVQIFSYQNKYYTYFPCDFCTDYTVQFTSNLMITKGCEGPFANSIAGFQKKNDSEFTFSSQDSFGRRSHLYIKFIDRNNHIAVFKTQTPDETFYYLMMDASKVKNLPIIVNECTSQKQPEFNGFDLIDLTELYNQN